MSNNLILEYPRDFVKIIKDKFPNDRKMNLFVDTNDYFLGSYLDALLDNPDNNLSKKEEELVESLWDMWVFIVEEQMDGQNLVEATFTKKGPNQVYDKELDIWIDEQQNDALGG